MKMSHENMKIYCRKFKTQTIKHSPNPKNYCCEYTAFQTVCIGFLKLLCKSVVSFTLA